MLLFGREFVAEVSAPLSILTIADRHCGKTEKRERDGIAIKKKNQLILFCVHIV